MENLSKRRYVSPFAFALIYLGLGDSDGFFKYMIRDIEEGTALNIRDFPPFRRVCSDPRFASLLRMMNLEP